MLPYSIIAAFADEQLGFRGNNAAVIKLDNALPAIEMQRIAGDLNQPATTFLWEKDNQLFVRWFAPDGEINLCGHGSLAAFSYLDSSTEILLHHSGGEISGWKTDDGLVSMKIKSILSKRAGDPDEAIQTGISGTIKGYYTNSNKNIVLLEDEAAVANANPDFSILKKMDPFGITLTAPGNKVDFVSRTLVPKVQQLEDHATGSSHAALVPFWSERLNKEHLTAHQLSPRGGKFHCQLLGDYVVLTGKTNLIANGQLM